MLRRYTHFEELRTKAADKLKGRGTLEEQLANALVEISIMREEEVPEHKWSEVQSIIASCKTHKAKGQEGIFRASINEMTYEEKQILKKAILTL